MAATGPPNTDVQHMSTGWRLIDDIDAPASAAEHMAADLRLLDEVAAGAPSALRLYTWRPPALSLGRFQPDTDVDREACALAGAELVRRPTGGRALLHGGDVTYAAAFPRPAGAAGSVDRLFHRLAAALIVGLAQLGVRADVGHGAADGDIGPACFSSARGADLRVGGRKLCGSAQLQRDGAVLQHGSVLCRRLALDETDLLAFADDAARRAARSVLRERTVTLAELGVPSLPSAVAGALICGFAHVAEPELLDLK